MNTKWNRYNIGQTLKDWINSIAKVRYSSKEYKKLIFIRKTVATFDEKGSYGNGNSVQYEFLCPVSQGIMMIYKGKTTFKDYDFTHKHPNPRLREMVKSDPSLADTHGFAAE